MTARLSTCGICGGTIRKTTAGWVHIVPPRDHVTHRPDPDDSAVVGPAEDDLVTARLPKQLRTRIADQRFRTSLARAAGERPVHADGRPVLVDMEQANRRDARNAGEHLARTRADQRDDLSWEDYR